MSRTYHHGFKAKDRNGKNDNWYANEPKAWRRQYKHKIRRAQARQLAHRALHEPEQVWPLDKKPWIYYW